ncbi:MAG: hypothetical protein JEY99_21610 [Spirochaetales bacterium]|nr:hypothetical protein [Spirochaetales bacterium]
MRSLIFKILSLSILFIILSLFISCPNTTGTNPDGTEDSDGDSTPYTKGIIDEYFWGSWVRMDGGDEAWYFTDGRVTVGDSTYNAASPSDNQISIPGYSVLKQTDNMAIVEPSDSLMYHLFRKSGATANVSGEVLGGVVSSLSSRGLGGIGGINVILENIQISENRIEDETDSEGNLNFDDIISGDTYTMTIPIQDNVEEEIVVDIIPSFDGEDIGNITLTEADQNFKVSPSIGGGDEWGYYYVDQYYDLSVVITNFGDENLVDGSYELTVPSGISLNGSSETGSLGFISGSGGTFSLNFSVMADSFLDDYQDFEIPVSIISSDNLYRWNDSISLRFFRETMTIHVRSDETENGFGVKGVVISPDNRSFPFKTENRHGSIVLPALESGYVLALSGADYTTETRYSLMINGIPPRDGSDLRTASINEPNNIEPMGTDAFLLHEYQGFLGVYDLDFYNIHNYENDIPFVSGDYHTANDRPTWTWSIPEDSNGFRYRFSDEDDWTETYSASYTPSIELEPGYYRLSVQSLNSDGEWSESGECLVEVDNLYCVKADAGDLYSLFLMSDGSVYGCGNTYRGVLGPQEFDVEIPVKLADGMRDISVGPNSYTEPEPVYGSYMVTLDGRLMQLDGDSSELEEIMTGVRSIEASTGVLYIITFDGSLYTSGSDNSTGMLGNGTRNAGNIPLMIMTDIRKAQGGRRYSLALTTTGELYGFGDLSGILGDRERLSPYLLMTGVSDFAAGGRHLLVVKEDGTLLSSGYNFYGQLGLGDTESRTSLEEVASGVKMVDASGSLSLFVTEEGVLFGMGENKMDYRQLVVGIYKHLEPVEIKSNVISISAGWNHTFHITKDNIAYGHGRDIDGECGRELYSNEVVFPDL